MAPFPSKGKQDRSWRAACWLQPGRVLLYPSVRVQAQLRVYCVDKSGRQFLGWLSLAHWEHMLLHVCAITCFLSPSMTGICSREQGSAGDTDHVRGGEWARPWAGAPESRVQPRLQEEGAHQAEDLSFLCFLYFDVPIFDSWLMRSRKRKGGRKGKRKDGREEERKEGREGGREERREKGREAGDVWHL